MSSRVQWWRSTAKVRNRLLGIAFFVLVALFLWTTVAIYNKTFVNSVDVRLITDSVGNSLTKNADVKARGVNVGEVRSSRAEGGEVTLELAIDPDRAEQIPVNTTARLLPKTLFGERYVDLVIPQDPSPEHLTSGVTLHQDASGNAIEVSQLLDDLLPLLQAIPPQDLAATLGALSQALSGQGEGLGATLDRLDVILTDVNAVLPELREGLRSLAETAVTYADAAPQLIDALDNLRTTNATIVQRRTDIDVLLATLTPTSAATADFLIANHDNIIDIAADARPALELLATYSPTYVCALANFAEMRPRIDQIMGMGTDRPGSRVTIELINTRGRYLPNQDEPRWLDTRGPSCFPEFPLGVDAGQYPGGPNNDGSYQVPSRNPGDQQIGAMQAPQFGVFPAGNTPTLAGSPGEQHALGAIYGAVQGVSPDQVPGWVTRIAAPAFRGSEVSVR
ncbi:MCE family protein [Nocardia cyriacigeorgica]|uniref:MCE family protein n=1 Tax=Nocardia cyriacigeorgica TaxID=135487 RepID=A0A6P1D4Y4_9NOCA|nr:MCE family protein [Nocardia cyriacigeorgica]NEW42142.1 MCE family protein [Nocardia cyriacigeorgica]NEW44521.1 MCE family protein [Nocardia cyriacigeorgica]NEW53160.1 MCE family protein [Nocardia cyriacigeorgica]NEW55919.1 MCE family protein [Nocardia cyriacigeorgica]